MATYATVTDFENHIEGWETTDSAALERVLQRAERDVDRVLGPIRRDPDTGLKLAPATDLTAAERAALARAVSAQAHYRIDTLGEGTAGAEPARRRVKGPDFEVEYVETAATSGGTGLLAPAVALELEPLRHLRPAGARARP